MVAPRQTSAIAGASGTIQSCSTQHQTSSETSVSGFKQCMIPGFWANCRWADRLGALFIPFSFGSVREQWNHNWLGPVDMYVWQFRNSAEERNVANPKSSCMLTHNLSDLATLSCHSHYRTYITFMFPKLLNMFVLFWNLFKMIQN